MVSLMLMTAADTATLRARWGWLFGAGVVLAILGVIALMNVVSATLVTTFIVGLVLIVAGVVDIFAAFTGGTESGGWRILRFVLGVLYIVVGLDLVANPALGALTLIVVVGLLLVFDGIMKLIGAFMGTGNRLLLIAIGIIDILLGVWAITNIPFSAPVIGFFVGLMLVMAGISWMVSGWSLKSGALP
jgi:uncharacterized membrane protein HdeD (DUF308 family)